MGRRLKDAHQVGKERKNKSDRVIEAPESTVMGLTVEEHNARSRKEIKARKENVLGAIIGS